MAKELSEKRLLAFIFINVSIENSATPTTGNWKIGDPIV